MYIFSNGLDSGSKGFLIHDCPPISASPLGLLDTKIEVRLTGLEFRILGACYRRTFLALSPDMTAGSRHFPKPR